MGDTPLVVRRVTVHRFFVDPAAIAGDRFTVPTTIAHQVRTVLRLRDGEKIVLLPGDGSEVRCRLDGGECVVESRGTAEGEARHRLMLVQALIKGDALDDVVRHGTELGVAEFTLVVTERSVVRDMSDRRVARLQAIAREAAEQSERGIVPPVRPPVALRDLLPAIGRDGVLLAERQHGTRLRDLDPPAAVVIGPEGGFSQRELGLAQSTGMRIAGLGRRILRSETAGPAAAAVILSRSGDFA